MKYVICAATLLLFASCSKNSSSPTQSTTPSGSSAWSISTVDSTGNTGEHTSIAVDQNNNPHITYLNTDSGVVMYAEWNGSAWVREMLGDAKGPYTTGGRSGIALDASGNPYVVYHQADVSYFYTNRIASASWSTPEAIPWTESAWAFLGHCSIAVDPVTSAVHVALWLYDSQQGYMLGYWGPGLSSAEFVDGYQFLTGKNNSIAIDPNGIPWISYEGRDDSNNVVLKVAHRTISSWQASTVDTIQTTEGYAHLTSIAVDDNGNAHVAYYSHRDGAYKYASWNGSTWDLSTITTYGSVGWEDVSLALDSNGNPHVAMLTGFYKLKYATWNGTGWTVETVDNTTGFDCSIAVGSDGSAHISYYDDNSGDLKYARRSP